MSTEQITDAQVLAELLPEERQAWLHGITREERIMVMRRLALARIEAREARAGIEARDHHMISCPYCGKRTHGDHSSTTTSHIISCADVAIGTARREAREAAAREREACAVLVSAVANEWMHAMAYADGGQSDTAQWLDEAASRIRARGGAA